MLKSNLEGTAGLRINGAQVYRLSTREGVEGTVASAGRTAARASRGAELNILVQSVGSKRVSTKPAMGCGRVCEGRKGELGEAATPAGLATSLGRLPDAADDNVAMQSE